MSSRVGPAAAATFAGGAVFALQTRVNGELGSRSGAAVWAALVSFGSGLLLLAALIPLLPPVRRALRPAVRDRLPWWAYSGGLSGATAVAVSAVAVPRVGVATYTVGVVAGQAIGGLRVDRAGISPGGPRPLTATRVGGSLLAVAAVALIRLAHTGGATSGGVVLALLLAAAASGAWISVQQALNGRVQRATGQPLLAALVNFAVGTGALLVGFGVVAATGHGPTHPWPAAGWLYAGGALGIVYIATAAWTVRPLGVLRLGLLTVAGQLAGGVLIDLVSPAAGASVGPVTVIAVLLTLVGVAIAGHDPQSRSRRRTSATETATPTAR